MINIQSIHTFTRAVLAPLLWVFVFFSSNVFADDLPGMADIAFTNPTVVASMPDEWVKQGIRYETEQTVDLALTLDQQLYPILMPFIQEFAAREQIKIAIEEGTCGVSAGALARKTVDMGGFCCPPGDIDRLPGLRFHTIAIGALAVITNPLNNTKDLSLAKVRELFGGQISHWAGVPTSGFRKDHSSPVQAVTRQHCAPRPGHWKLIISDKEKFSPTALGVSAINDMLNAVAKYPFSVGYETLWHIKGHADSAKVNILTVDGVNPHDLHAVAAGRYPFYRVFNVTTWEGPEVQDPMADKLVAYMLANSERIRPMTGLVTADTLRDNGWQFVGNELTGGPR